MNLQEKTLTCQDCRKPFSFGVREQQSHQQKGYTSAPKRCPKCRRTRRDGREQPNGSVQNTGRVQANGGPRSTGRAQSTGGLQTTRRINDGRGPKSNDAIPCARCGAPTRVPVQPGSGRHVYCSSCYTKQPAYSRTY